MNSPRTLLLLCAVTLFGACATSERGRMGVVSDLSRVEGPAQFCEHEVPEQVCTRHHPELVAKFKAVNDWCGPHDVPESQCFKCHPELTFEALPKLGPGDDVQTLVKGGEDLPDLSGAAVAGKVTVFDFYADWCAPCREVDLHLYKKLKGRPDLAVRKLNVVDWDSALAKRHLAGVTGLPYLVVYGKDGKEAERVEGFDLQKLDAAIEKGSK